MKLSGLIDLSQGYVVIDAYGKPCDKSEKINKTDANNDGSVSQVEYMAYTEKKFNQKTRTLTES